MYSSLKNILYFITEDDFLKTVEYMNNAYIKTIINNNILELAMSIKCTSDKKLLVNTIDAETHILNLNNNTCEKILYVNNIDGIPAKIYQMITSMHTTVTLIYTHKIINIEKPSHAKAVVDLHLIHDEIIISTNFVPRGLLVVFTNLNTKILEYNIRNNTCCTKNENIKIIKKKYHTAYLLDTNVLFVGDDCVDIYEKTFVNYHEILSNIEIKTYLLLNQCIYILGKVHNQWLLYCYSSQQQENSTVITIDEKKYYICKIFDELCEKVDIYRSCCYHGYICCTCILKYILLVHDTTNIEFIDSVSKIATSYKMDYQIESVIDINCNNLIIVTDTHDLKYYEIMQDIDGKFIMNYKGSDEHKLKTNHKYSKKAMHHL